MRNSRIGTFFNAPTKSVGFRSRYFLTLTSSTKAAALVDDVKVRKYLERKPTDFVGALKNVPIRLLRMYVNAYQSYLWNKTVATYLEKVGKVLKKVSYSEGE